MSEPVAVIKDYNRKTGDKTLSIIQHDQLQDMLIIHADLDKLREIRIETQDTLVILRKWRGDPESPDGHETYVLVKSRLFPKGFPDVPERDRLRLDHFDTHREGAGVTAFGSRHRDFDLDKIVEDQPP